MRSTSRRIEWRCNSDKFAGKMAASPTPLLLVLVIVIDHGHEHEHEHDYEQDAIISIEASQN
jgi:hypothetical protein